MVGMIAGGQNKFNIIQNMIICKVQTSLIIPNVLFDDNIKEKTRYYCEGIK